jgi:hypothetical protein
VRCEKVDGGYRIGSHVVDKVWVYADIVRGIALWSGSEDEVRLHFDSVRAKCKSSGILDEFDRSARMVCLPDDVDMVEMSYMVSRHIVPRRVLMRMR